MTLVEGSLIFFSLLFPARALQLVRGFVVAWSPEILLNPSLVRKQITAM